MALDLFFKKQTLRVMYLEYTYGRCFTATLGSGITCFWYKYTKSIPIVNKIVLNIKVSRYIIYS